MDILCVVLADEPLADVIDEAETGATNVALDILKVFLPDSWQAFTGVIRENVKKLFYWKIVCLSIFMTIACLACGAALVIAGAALDSQVGWSFGIICTLTAGHFLWELVRRASSTCFRSILKIAAWWWPDKYLALVCVFCVFLLWFMYRVGITCAVSGCLWATVVWMLPLVGCFGLGRIMYPMVMLKLEKYIEEENAQIIKQIFAQKAAKPGDAGRMFLDELGQGFQNLAVQMGTQPITQM